MSNASTVRRQIAGTQQLTLAPLSGTTITTTRTAFQLNNNGLTLTGGGVIPLSAGVTGLYQGTGQVLHIAAAGSFSGATEGTTTLGFDLWQVPASLLPIANTLAGAQTFTNWNVIASTAATPMTPIAITTDSGSFTLDCRAQLDAAGNLEGQFTVGINGGVVKVYGVFAPITGLVGEADLNFVLTAAISGGDESGVILTLNELRLDLE